MSVVVVDEHTGQVLQVRAFDTYEQPGDLLLTFLTSLPLDRIVVMTTYDEASYSLGKAGQAAARLIGSTMIDALNYRANWAIIGRKGALLTMFEDVAPAVHKGSWGWASSVRIAHCVPLMRVGTNGVGDDVRKAGGNETKLAKSKSKSSVSLSSSAAKAMAMFAPRTGQERLEAYLKLCENTQFKSGCDFHNVILNCLLFVYLFAVCLFVVWLFVWLLCVCLLFVVICYFIWFCLFLVLFVLLSSVF